MPVHKGMKGPGAAPRPVAPLAFTALRHLQRAADAHKKDPLRRQNIDGQPEHARVVDNIVHDYVEARRCKCGDGPVHPCQVLVAKRPNPHLGQGMNLALVDAFRFTACLREAPTPLAAFRAFRQAQRAYLRYYATVTWLLSPFFQSDEGLLAVGRDLALPCMPSVPFVKRQMLLTVLKKGFLGGETTL